MLSIKWWDVELYRKISHKPLFKYIPFKELMESDLLNMQAWYSVNIYLI